MSRLFERSVRRTDGIPDIGGDVTHRKLQFIRKGRYSLSRGRPLSETIVDRFERIANLDQKLVCLLVHRNRLFLRKNAELFDFFLLGLDTFRQFHQKLS